MTTQNKTRTNKVKTVNPYNRKLLLKAPVRKWDDVNKEYDRILLVPSGTKHESGYMHIAVIGVCGKFGEETFEIAAYPDDISTFFPPFPNVPWYAQVRMDCFYPSGIFQYHGHGKFRVSSALSSVDITFTPSKR